MAEFATCAEESGCAGLSTDIVSSVQVTRRETEDRALWEVYEWIVTDGDGGYREWMTKTGRRW